VSGEQRPSQQWIVKVSGAEEIRVSPGQSIEIGRKPMRPIAADNVRRLDVPDNSKSMSKRHALFQVTVSGSATLRDLGSTNGSYIIRNDGGLIRVPVETDFLLPRSPMRFQFGDVPVDFVKVDVTVEQRPSVDVSDLFTYATSDVVQEPDAADMSVDDILDLRAGEPTSAFDASSVRSRIHALHDQALRDQRDYGNSDSDASLPDNSIQAGLNTPQEGAIQFPSSEASNTQTSGTGDEGESTRVISLSPKDAQRALSTAVETPQAEQEQQTEGESDKSSQVETTDHSSEAQKSEDTEQPTEDVEADGHVDDANNRDNAVEAQHAIPSDDANTTASQEPSAAEEQTAEPAQQRDLFADALDDVFAGEGATSGESETTPDDAAQVAGTPANTVHFQPLAAAQLSSQEQLRQQEAYEHSDASQSDNGAAQSPTIFEPGSVFERVSQGGFEPPQPLVEVEGMTSDDARNSRDFAEQFEMAKHPELLPFLAMNVALYDDLYAWLAAQGNQDVDTALSKNKGYQEYLAATRK
jgi:hypothetical protein